MLPLTVRTSFGRIMRGVVMNLSSFNDVFTVSIADLPVMLDLTQCDSSTRSRIAEHYNEFIVPSEPAEFSIRVRIEPGSPFIQPTAASTWQVKTIESNGRIEFESFFETGWADRTTGEGELVLRAEGEPENFLRVLYAWLSLKHDGLLLHACGVISKEKGYVFFGASGSGKTTTARFSLDRTVLSDDLVIIKKQDGIFRLYGVPFRGDFIEAPRSNASADLRGLFTLTKDSKHFLAPVELQEAIARLASCVPFVMAQPSAARRVSEICIDLATHVQVQSLHFRRDPGFWEVIDGFR
jgi:hypothetical protein